MSYESTEILLIGSKCYHKFEKLSNVSVRKCEMKLIYDDVKKTSTWYHVVHFREALNDASLRAFDSVQCALNQQNEIQSIREQLPGPVLVSLYTISSDVSWFTLQNLISNVIMYVCKLTKMSVVNSVLLSGKNGAKSFCEHVAAISYLSTSTHNNNNSLSFVHLNRFTLKSVKLLKNKNRLLAKQLISLFDVIKYQFFDKKSTKKGSGSKTIGGTTGTSLNARNSSTSITAVNPVFVRYACTECRLRNFVERFVNAEYGMLHFLFCKAYTSTDVAQNIRNLCIFNSDLEEILMDAIECTL